MILYSICVLLYIGTLLLVKPEPKSFKDPKISIKENFIAIKGSIVLGVLFLTIHLLTTNFTFLKVDENIYNYFALNNFQDNNFKFMQFFTHIFIHYNLVHLISNVVMIGVLSVYERRVGLKRFLIVFIISGLSSGISILFYSDNIFTSGISGAIFGIAAAFFTDEKNLTKKDWIYAILVFFIIAIMLSISDYFDSNKLKDNSYEIDYIAHIIGAIFAIIYTRIYKLK